MDRTFLGIGAVMGFLGVALGAFGAHGLQNKLDPQMMAVYEVGVRYQMYHALALLALAPALARWPSRVLTVVGWGFVVGIVVFSGSLYVLALTGVRWLGAITPIGGVAFLVGWLALARFAFSSEFRESARG